MLMLGIIELDIILHDGKIEKSLSDLQKAITLNKKYGYDALKDKDFDKIRDDPRFIELLRRFKE